MVAAEVRTVSEGVPSGLFNRAVARRVQITLPPTLRLGNGPPAAAASAMDRIGLWDRSFTIWLTVSGATPTASINAGLTELMSKGPLDPHTERQSRMPPRAYRRPSASAMKFP